MFKLLLIDNFIDLSFSLKILIYAYHKRRRYIPGVCDKRSLNLLFLPLLLSKKWTLVQLPRVSGTGSVGTFN